VRRFGPGTFFNGARVGPAAKAVLLVAFLSLPLASGCSEELDAGWTAPHGPLPVDERNPIIIINDGSIDNWQGEYAVLLASSGGPKLVGIIVNISGPWKDFQANVSGWRDLASAATASGLRDIPDPTESVGAQLVRPASGNIDDTKSNRSAGARLILEMAEKYAKPHRPLAVVTGGALTDVADAYLLDHTIAERVVVVSSLGTVTSTGGAMTSPNGEMDSWADTIVAMHLPYVQVSAFYDQKADFPDASLSQLPKNALGDRIRTKQPGVWNDNRATDQVGVLAVGLPGFAMAVERVSYTGIPAAGAMNGPDLTSNLKGPSWLVTACNSDAVPKRIWRALHDPKTFGP